MITLKSLILCPRYKMNDKYTKQTFELLKDFQKDTVQFAYKNLEKNRNRINLDFCP